MEENILDIQNLKVFYKTYRGIAKVVNGVSLYVKKGEKVGLVGESGCGKTTTMKSVIRILDEKAAVISEGEIFFKGRDVLKMKPAGIRDVRLHDVAMISQSPMSALNPVFTVGEQIMDIIRFHGQIPQKDAMRMALDAVRSVMIADPERIMKSYPNQLSGGMCQRICIAMALVTPRDLLIADEPGTALDVTVQDQIHRLLRTLVSEKNMSLVMITHSLGVTRELVDRIYVMYAGNIVEESVTADLFKNPLHPYTQGLMKCVPRLSGGGVSEGIYGYLPDYINPTPGCRFYPRCSRATEECKHRQPPLVKVGEGHSVACFCYGGGQTNAQEGTI